VLEEELERLAINDRVAVLAGGCQSHCETGPSMVVYPGPVFYRYIDKARLQRIAREHLAGDTPVADFLWVDPEKSGWRDRRPYPPTPSPQTPSFDTTKDKKPQKQKPRKTYDVDDFKW
jgi:(2Fe-2S) ferredoxin